MTYWTDLTPISTYFSATYLEAREKFLMVAQSHNAKIERHILPHARGPGGLELSLDCAILGPDQPSAAIVIISGTHGPEGYCGSGVQFGLMASGWAQTWANNIRLVFIHAHNPFGFAWDSRFNEDNIDLNRNYLPDFSKDLPANPIYDLLANWAAPRQRDAGTLTQSHVKLLEFGREHGLDLLQAALTGGQYSHPKGLYFGGFAPSWSNRTLHELIARHCVGLDCVVTLDLHTGLGSYGHGELITQASFSCDHYRRQRDIWGDQIRSTKDIDSVSSDLSGTLDGAILAALEPTWTVCVALEFGTLDAFSVFTATQASSWLHCYGNPEGPEAAEIRQASRAAFYPEEESWKEMVWARSLDVIGRAADYLGKSAT
ncbi:M14 family metallopeptidase [Candidatus Phycosocius spiralis]|uniref:DUF2817 domain-containing protein n=1 Tax=Candidatus Phycosocius spiralis TaxID=2815099 RepID=A0ABQ4PXI2_9PROT|nr:M14 family metallopeptidase [Candidatus Phycosocius spiralis]GIU67374.1 hypothetical protein PsB1_1528 [Candidatus Phycosocius spiralis]